MSPGWLSPGAWALVLCSIAAAAAYSDLEAAGDLNDVLYQEDNEGGHGLGQLQLEPAWSPTLLERLLTASAHDPDGYSYRTPWEAPVQQSLTLLPQKRTPTLLDLKTMPGFDRFYKTLVQGKRAPGNPPTKQPRWKTKKGRPSSGYMCYFKLCSFRTTRN